MHLTKIFFPWQLGYVAECLENGMRESMQCLHHDDGRRIGIIVLLCFITLRLKYYQDMSAKY
jgi:hypothetical protein